MHFDVSELSELAKQYVLRILFVEQPVTQTVMTAWMTNQYGRCDCILLHFTLYLHHSLSIVNILLPIVFMLRLVEINYTYYLYFSVILLWFIA